MEKWYPSRFGPDDVLGAMNLITPRSILTALALVKRGVIYDLSHVLEQDQPDTEFHGAFFANTQHTLESGAEWHTRRSRRGYGMIGKMKSAWKPKAGRLGVQNLRISMSDHSGTHIDQLNHVGIQQENGEFLLYNGIRNSDVISSFGTTKLGVEQMPPLISRGVLIDVVGYKGVEIFPAGYAISPDELDSALASQNVEVREGDTVLVHTGWGKKWGDPEEYSSGEPGLSKACAEWAVKKNIVCWGIDQFATDPIPFEYEDEALPMHCEMLVKNGIRIMENVYLEEIARDKVYEFCVVAAALKIKGGTGSPIRLLALA